jgi:hypothetical protein
MTPRWLYRFALSQYSRGTQRLAKGTASVVPQRYTIMLP